MSEEILGTIEIDHEVLYFTLNRAIVAKTGGKGAIALGAIAFGMIGAGLAARA